MADRQTLSGDLHELLSRINSDGMVCDHPGGRVSLEASLLALPTLAERGKLAEMRKLATAVLDRRDESGGWDNPWLTMLGVEAFVALKLRGFTVDGSESVLEFAVNVLRGAQPLEPMEREMRLARAIILAGMARQDAALIDAGIFRIHGLLEHNGGWDGDLSQALHSLLTLADLHAITKDEPTLDLLNQRTAACGLLGLHTNPEDVDSETLARAGVVLVKLQKMDEALAVYQRVAVVPSSAMSSAALKHRIELGARLEEMLPEGSSEASEPDSEAEPAVEVSAPVTPQPVTSRVLALQGHTSPTLTAIVVEDGDPAEVTRTVDALLTQATPPDEIVVTWSSPVSPLSSTSSTSVRQLHDRPGTSAAALAQAAIKLASGQWVVLVRPMDQIHAGLCAAFRSAIEKVGDQVSAIHAAPRANSTVPALDRLMIEPSLASNRVAFRRSAVEAVLCPVEIRHDLGWALSLSLSVPDAWWEVVVPAAVDEADSPVINPAVLEDAHAIWRAFAGKSDIDERRTAWLIEARQSAYSAAQAVEHPVVSVILDLRGSKRDVEPSLKAALECTGDVPFEMLALIEEDSDLDQALDRLGIFSVKTPISTGHGDAYNQAVDQAQAPYLAFVDGPLQLSDGWLPALLHTLQEQGAGLVSGRVDGPGGAHGGAVIVDGDTARVLTDDELSSASDLHGVSGGVVLVRGDFLRATGGFPNYPRPWRWLDLSQRLLSRREPVLLHRDVHASAATTPHPLSPMPAEFKASWGSRLNAGGAQAVATDSGATPVQAKAESAGEGIRRLLANAEELIREKRYDAVDESLTPAEDQLNGNIGERVLFWTLLGDARFRLDRPDDAFTCYQKAVQDDPSAVRAWIGIGTYHMVKDDFDTASDIFEKVITLSPENLRGHLGLGNTKLRAQQADAAIPHFQQALRLDPGYRHAVVGLVAASVQAEKMGEAEDGLSSYLLQRPEDVEARFHLAAILFGTNQLIRAREEAEEVLRMKPDHAGAKEILQHVAGQTSS